MHPFNYHRATSVEDAAAAFRAAEDGAYLSGGHTLLPTMKQRLAAPSDLIDLAGIAGLAGIAVDGAAVEVGARTPHASVAASAEVQGAIPALAALAGVEHRVAVGIQEHGAAGGGAGRADSQCLHRAYVARILGGCVAGEHGEQQRHEQPRRVAGELVAVLGHGVRPPGGRDCLLRLHCPVDCCTVRSTAALSGQLLHCPVGAPACQVRSWR